MAKTIKGEHRKQKSEAARFAALFIDSQDYRDSLSRRIANDRLPPAIEGLLLAYRYGKPTERREVTFPEGVPDYSGLSVDELAQRAAEISKDLADAQRLVATVGPLPSDIDPNDLRRVN